MSLFLLLAIIFLQKHLGTSVSAYLNLALIEVSSILFWCALVASFDCMLFQIMRHKLRGRFTGYTSLLINPKRGLHLL